MTRHHRAILGAWALGASILAFAGAPALAQDEETTRAGIDVIRVTAQKKTESLLDVPIAVTAFDSEGLDRLQIDNFSDLQFNTPNVTYAKGNFTGNNFQIRGIGSTLVAASSDTGVGIHVNDVYLNSNRIFELEYFDIERVEVLRGPQGTLYGRNATGGTVNMITKRPLMDEFELIAEAQYGNFDHMKFKGAANIPIVENKLALRVAGIVLDRDGYTENIFDGSDVDDRSQFALRGTLRWQPTSSTTVDVMASYFREDDSRTRSQKQLCHRDASAVLGCLPDSLEFETVNGNATLGGLLVTDIVIGPLNPAMAGYDLSLADFFGPGGQIDSINPPDMRKVNMDFAPDYHADETFVMAELNQGMWGGKLNLTLLGAWQQTSVNSQQDYNMTVSDPATVPSDLATALPLTNALYFADGLLPTSAIDPGTNTGVIGFNFLKRGNLLEAYDQSFGGAEQWSFEGRITSNFDGPFNFLVAGYYLTYDSEFDYYVVATALDYFALVGGGALASQGILNPANGAFIADGLAFAPPYYNNETDAYELDSWAAFGEAYYQLAPDLKLTGGLRYTVDKKFVRDRVVLFDIFAPLATSDLEPLLIDATNNIPFYNFFDADGSTPQGDIYREAEVEFSEITGRAVIDWTPDLSFTDATLIYASYSRGYKAGGLNPPFNPILFPNTASTYDPEFINAYEIGTKNTLLDNTLQANLSAFYYDYGGLQVSKIFNRTSFNENIDATIWGLEGEFLYAPNDRWLFNTTVAYLNTEIGDSLSVDTRDPTNGAADVLLLKDLTNASNCVLESTGGAPPDGALLTSIDPGLYVPPQTFFDPFDGIDFTEGLDAPTGFSSCEALATIFNTDAVSPVLNSLYELTDGVPVNLKGNRLQNAPEWTFNAGVQYTHPFANNYSVTLRYDYYWQGDMYGRIFNKPIDLIDSWDIMNAQITLYGPDQRWYLRFFIQNIEGDDNIVGMYVTDPSSGLFTNVFTLEPRLYGVTAGIRF